jgi:hypothetical protein
MMALSDYLKTLHNRRKMVRKRRMKDFEPRRSHFSKVSIYEKPGEK